MTTITVSNDLLDEIQDEISWFLEHAGELKRAVYSVKSNALHNALAVRLDALRKLRVAVRDAQDPDAPSDVEIVRNEGLDASVHFVLLDGVKVGYVAVAHSPNGGYWAYATGGRMLTNRPLVTFDAAVSLILAYRASEAVGGSEPMRPPAADACAPVALELSDIRAAGQDVLGLAAAVRVWTNLTKAATGRRGSLTEAAEAFHLRPSAVLSLVPGPAFAVERPNPVAPARTITVDLDDGAAHIVVRARPSRRRAA